MLSMKVFFLPYAITFGHMGMSIEHSVQICFTLHPNPPFFFENEIFFLYSIFLFSSFSISKHYQQCIILDYMTFPSYRGTITHLVLVSNDLS